MSAPAIAIRPYRPEDAERLAEIYRDAVERLASDAYSPAHIVAWARFPEDLEAFRASLCEGITLCAVAEEVPVAFAQLHPMDHIALTYCASSHARRGLMSRLYRMLEEEARRAGSTRLYTEASLVGHPFFARMGFEIAETEHVERHGVVFERYRMEKHLR